MGVHFCPIEPPDWSDGPDDPNDSCPDCDGSGIGETQDQPCEICGGLGYIPQEPYYFGDDL